VYINPRVGGKNERHSENNKKRHAHTKLTYNLSAFVRRSKLRFRCNEKQKEK
jgi:hypothetical protein